MYRLRLCMNEYNLVYMYRLTNLSCSSLPALFRYSYQIDLALPPTAAGDVVTTTVTSSNPSCIVTTSKTYTFDAATWKVKQSVTIETTDDASFSTKDQQIYSCNIVHSTVSKNGAAFGDDKTLSLSITSVGCGEGEYFGEYDRKGDANLCVCSKGFFFNPVDGCTVCPLRESECETEGMVVPITKGGWWREQLSSNNLTSQPFYECPTDISGACLGGDGTNSSFGCAKGYNANGTLCAICSPGFVLTGKKCERCLALPTSVQDAMDKADREVPGGLVGVFLASLFMLMLVFMYFMMRPALSMDDETRIRDMFELFGTEALFAEMLGQEYDEDNPLTEADFGKQEVTMKQFVFVLENKRAGLNPEQFELLFKAIDDDGGHHAGGGVDFIELSNFLGDDVGERKNLAEMNAKQKAERKAMRKKKGKKK